MILKRVYLFSLFFLLLCGVSLAQSGGTQHYLNAEDFKKAKKYDAALIEYDKAIAKEPTKAEYIFGKAQCYLEMKNVDHAVKGFEQVITLKSSYVEAHEMLAKIYDQKKMYEKSVEYYDNAAKYEENNAKKLEYKLHTLKLLNKAAKYEALSVHIAEAKQLSPNNNELLLLEARNNNMLGKYDEVIAAMTSYISTVGKGQAVNQLAQPNYELGFAYYKKEMYDKAMPILAKAEVGPFKTRVYELKPEYYVEMATAYSKIYEYEKSEEFLGQALKINPQFKGALELKRQIATTRKDESKKIRAEEDSARLERNPNRRSERYCILCRKQFDASMYDGAMTSADECIKTQPRNTLIRFYKAMASYKLGNMDDAIIALDALTKIPSLDPEMFSRFNFALGMMYKKSQQADIAKTFFRKAKGSFANAAKAEVKSMTTPGETSEEEGAGGETPTEGN